MFGTGKLYSIIEIGRPLHKIDGSKKKGGDYLLCLLEKIIKYKIFKYRPKVKIKDYINEFIKKRKKNKILIIGAGPVGCTIAEILSKKSFEVRLIDSRDHIAGNCYDFKNEFGILVHKYGPHYFRTNNKNIIKYLNKFTKWIAGNYVVNSSVDQQYYEFPINLITINKFF